MRAEYVTADRLSLPRAIANTILNACLNDKCVDLGDVPTQSQGHEDGMGLDVAQNLIALAFGACARLAGSRRFLGSSE